MSLFDLIIANKAPLVVGSLTTATVTSVSVPAVLSYSTEQTDSVVEGDVVLESPASFVHVSNEQPQEVLFVVEEQADVPAAEEDEGVLSVDDNVYAQAVMRKDSLRAQAFNYKSKVSWVTREFVGLRPLYGSLAQCRAKNNLDSFKRYDFPEVSGAYTLVKEDDAFLDQILKNIDSGDLFQKQKIVEGNRNLNSFSDFNASLNELEEVYLGIEESQSVDKFAKQLDTVVATLKKDLDKCDLRDIIRLNDEIGKLHLSGN